MKNGIKNDELQECTKYIPARVTVIEITAQKFLCVSGSPSSVDNPWGGSEDDF